MVSFKTEACPMALLFEWIDSTSSVLMKFCWMPTNDWHRQSFRKTYHIWPNELTIMHFYLTHETGDSLARIKIDLWTWHFKSGNYMLVAHVIGMPLTMHCTTISSSSKRPSLMRSADAKSNLWLGTDHDESNTFQTKCTRCQKLHPIWPNHARRWFHWGHRIFREGVSLRVVLLVS